jgi:hypothetical protein
VKERIRKGDEMHVRSIVVAKGDFAETDSRVMSFREAIHKDYDGIVLCKEVIPHPPVRGRFGYASIPLKEGAVPTCQKPYRQFGEKDVAARKVTHEWIERGFLEPPTQMNCEWLSQAFVVPKKSATFPWRGVVDMRGPNSQTRTCAYPIPCIEDILVRQGKKFIFSVLDLRQAFHQQPLDPASRPITCTYTPLGVYQWTVNVMGLKNASVQFQRMMDDILREVDDIASCYIDDIIVGTWVEEGEDLIAQHDHDLRRVLEVLKKQQLVADISKCKLFVPEVEFCGHILGGGTRRPAPGKLLAIERWERPKTIMSSAHFWVLPIIIPAMSKIFQNMWPVCKISSKCQGKRARKGVRNP